MYHRYLLLITLFLLAACGSSALESEAQIDDGEQLYQIDFEAPDSFETGDFPDSGAELTIKDGVYMIRQLADSAAYIWGQGGESARNVSLTVEATPQNEDDNSIFGVMCRVNEDGGGYALLIGNDGYAGIARTDGRSMTFLFDWTQNDAIKVGAVKNELRAVCVDDYLALYVNDTLVANARDERYGDSGQVGLLAGVVFSEKGEHEALVAFDNLVVSEASLR